MRDIFNARAEFLGRWHRFETPRILGIDELYLNKRYRCILTNIEERTLLDLLATRRQDVVTNYLMKLKDRQKVEIVSMDMWNPYRAAVKAVLPQARIVVDKFHVVRMANDALERVRKGLRKELKPSQSRTLKGDRKILLKRAHEVSDRGSTPLLRTVWKGLKTSDLELRRGAASVGCGTAQCSQTDRHALRLWCGSAGGWLGRA